MSWSKFSESIKFQATLFPSEHLPFSSAHTNTVCIHNNISFHAGREDARLALVNETILLNNKRRCFKRSCLWVWDDCTRRTRLTVFFDWHVYEFGCVLALPMRTAREDDMAWARSVATHCVVLGILLSNIRAIRRNLFNSLWNRSQATFFSFGAKSVDPKWRTQIR